jgi:hypothetical protein
MNLRKIVAIVAAAALFVVAPAVIPLKPVQEPVRVASIITPCGVASWQPLDSANARPPMLIPCAGPQSVAPTWPIIVGLLSAGSVILNSFIVSQQQCRELTQQEALNSIFMPFVGMAFNENKSKCKIKIKH